MSSLHTSYGVCSLSSTRGSLIDVHDLHHQHQIFKLSFTTSLCKFMYSLPCHLFCTNSFILRKGYRFRPRPSRAQYPRDHPRGPTAASASQVTGGGPRIVNLAPIAAVTSLVPSSAKLKDLIGTSNPPKHDNGTNMCLSFLLWQGCWSNCRRANQHTSVLSANEQRRLQEYL
jgi:hypothetical protein